MLLEKWALIKANFGEKEFIDKGYYRLRETDQGYQLAYLVPGFCGETLVHPEITLQETADGNVTPIRLIDLEVTPVLNLDQKDQNKLDEATEQLFDKCLAAKQLEI